MIYYSFISYRINSFPEDLISVGMIMIDSDSEEFKIKISDLKMKIAKKIHPKKHIFKFFANTIKTMSKAKWSLEQLDYSARYQNGIIKISMPQTISCGLDGFDKMFYKRLEENFEIIKNV